MLRLIHGYGLSREERNKRPLLRNDEFRHAVADWLYSPMIDDYWFQACVTDTWASSDGPNRLLLQELVATFPGSTGAIRAREFLARGDTYLQTAHSW